MPSLIQQMENKMNIQPMAVQQVQVQSNNVEPKISKKTNPLIAYGIAMPAFSALGAGLGYDSFRREKINLETEKINLKNTIDNTKVNTYRYAKLYYAL